MPLQYTSSSSGMRSCTVGVSAEMLMTVSALCGPSAAASVGNAYRKT